MGAAAGEELSSRVLDVKQSIKDFGGYAVKDTAISINDEFL